MTEVEALETTEDILKMLADGGDVWVNPRTNNMYISDDGQEIFDLLIDAVLREYGVGADDLVRAAVVKVQPVIAEYCLNQWMNIHTSSGFWVN